MAAKLEEKEKELLIAKIFDVALNVQKLESPFMQVQETIKQYGVLIDKIYEAGRLIGFEQGKKNWINKNQN